MRNRQRKKPFWGLRNSNIINKSSKFFWVCVSETHTAQLCGKLAGICLPTPFPHPLQNRVPRVRILLPLPKTCLTASLIGPEFLGIPGFSRVLRWWDAVWIAAPRGVYFAVFSYLVVSVSNLSVWHIINKSSKIRGALPCASLLLLKIKSVCDSLQAGRVFFDVVHLGDLRGAVAQEVGHLPGRECFDGAVGLFHAVYQLGRKMMS